MPASTHTRSRRTIAQPAAFIFSQTGRRGTVSLMRHTRTRAELGRPVLSKIHPPVTLRSDAIPRDYTSRKITVHRKGVTRTGFAGREAGLPPALLHYPDFDLRNRGHESARLPYGAQGYSTAAFGLEPSMKTAAQPRSAARTYVLSFNINRPSVRCGPSAKLGRHLRSRFRCSMCSAVRMD